MKKTIALAGNPNSGKTTIFNHLVGAREKIGNWPGTTVEKKEGIMNYAERTLTIVDLPGTYSLSAYSIDEQIARNFLMKKNPSLTVAIIDASNLERNLYFVLQLLELGQNIVLNLNMSDIAKKRGIKINIKELSEVLHIPVVETVALKKQGIDQLRQEIITHLDKKPHLLHIDYGDLEEAILKLADFLDKNKVVIDNFNSRMLAIKIFEEDQGIRKHLKNHPCWQKILSQIDQTKVRLNDDLETLIIERKYAYLKGLLKECTTRFLTIEEKLTLSDKIDRFITNRFWGIPIFLTFIYGLFWSVFTVGQPLANLIAKLVSFSGKNLALLIDTVGLPEWFSSLVSDGIIAGVGGVLVFLPYILLLFLGISILEDTGYLARAAFIMDRLMHSLGLHGKSFIPMLLGFGCNIPGIMATRTLESNKDRILTIIILPLMSCSARLPVYTLFAAALFPKHAGLVVFSLYIIGIILAIIVARIFKTIFFKGEVAPLIMELPPYRLPHFKNILFHMWFKSALFVKKAGTIIFMTVVFVWLISSLPWGVEYASENSIIAKFGKLIAPIFRPAGFGFWQAAVALTLGIVAKEVVVGTFATLYGVQNLTLTTVLQTNFTPLSGYAFLIMTLIYMPCIATIALIKKETNAKWATLAVLYTLTLGWLLSVLVYQLGSKL